MQLSSIMSRPLKIASRLICMLILIQAQASATKCPDKINTSVWYLIPSGDAQVIESLPEVLSAGLHGEGAATLVVIRDARGGDFELVLGRIR